MSIISTYLSNVNDINQIKDLAQRYEALQDELMSLTDLDLDSYIHEIQCEINSDIREICESIDYLESKGY